MFLSVISQPSICVVNRVGNDPNVADARNPSWALHIAEGIGGRLIPV